MHWYDLTLLISLIPGKYASYFMDQMQAKVALFCSYIVSTTSYDARISSVPPSQGQGKGGKKVIAMVEGNRV